jgi:hypothetical protein
MERDETGAGSPLMRVQCLDLLLGDHEAAVCYPGEAGVAGVAQG